MSSASRPRERGRGRGADGVAGSLPVSLGRLAEPVVPPRRGEGAGAGGGLRPGTALGGRRLGARHLAIGCRQ